MRSRYKITDQDGVFFVTSTVVNWIPVFTKRIYFDTIIDSLKFCRKNKELKLHAYVIMENHIHMVASAPDLSGTLRALKGFTARQILELLKEDNDRYLLNEFAFYKQANKANSQHQFWQEGFYPKLIASPEMLHQKIEYVHNNPVKRGYVDAQEHWRYSSARNYNLGDHSVIEIDEL